MADQQPTVQQAPPSTEQPPATTAPPAAAAAQPDATGQQDYADKAFDAGLKNIKGSEKIDKKTREKITDGARGLFEKLTGKKVSSKISN